MFPFFFSSSPFSFLLVIPFFCKAYCLGICVHFGIEKEAREIDFNSDSFVPQYKPKHHLNTPIFALSFFFLFFFLKKRIVFVIMRTGSWSCAGFV